MRGHLKSNGWISRGILFAFIYEQLHSYNFPLTLVNHRNISHSEKISGIRSLFDSLLPRQFTHISIAINLKSQLNTLETFFVMCPRAFGIYPLMWKCFLEVQNLLKMGGN